MQYTNYFLFISEIIILFLLSHSLTRTISHFLYSTIRNKQVTIYLLAFLFFPGTVIHEMAHYLFAVILRVPAGEMKLMPEMIEDRIKLGSVMIGKTDPIRRMLIGVAPFLAGMGFLFGIIYFLSVSFHILPFWGIILSLYTIFEIANTMFSSNKDLEGTVELLLVVLILGVIFYILGFRIPASFFTFLFSTNIQSNIKKTSYFLSIPIGIDILVIMLMKGVLLLSRTRK